MKDKPQVKMVLPAIGGAGDTKVEINGEDIAERLKGLQLSTSAKSETVLVLYYGCYSTEVEGEMVVRHLCGMGDLVEEEGRE